MGTAQKTSSRKKKTWDDPMAIRPFVIRRVSHETQDSFTM
jgi:hypothetical protein